MWKGINVLLRKGTILLEINNINSLKVNFILNECKKKLPVKTKIVKVKV